MSNFTIAKEQNGFIIEQTANIEQICVVKPVKFVCFYAYKERYGEKTQNTSWKRYSRLPEMHCPGSHSA